MYTLAILRQNTGVARDFYTVKIDGNIVIEFYCNMGMQKMDDSNRLGGIIIFTYFDIQPKTDFVFKDIKGD